MFCVDCSCGPTPAITSRSGPQAQACPCQAHGQGCHWSWFGEQQRDAIHGRTGIRKDARRKKPVGMTTNQIPSAGRSYPWPHHRKWRGACSLGTGACRCIGKQRMVTYTRGRQTAEYGSTVMRTNCAVVNGATSYSAWGQEQVANAVHA